MKRGTWASITEAIEGLPGPWQPGDLVAANDTIVRLARLEGEFPWHQHDEDEVFICWDGSFRIEIEGAPPVILTAGDLFVVARRARHRPVADERAHALLIEKPETKQCGNQEIQRGGHRCALRLQASP